MNRKTSIVVVCFFAFAAVAPAYADEFVWSGEPGANWGGANWSTNGVDGLMFPVCGEALFTGESAASVLVDNRVTANKVTAEVDTTVGVRDIDPNDWKAAYRYYRFYVDIPKADGGSMQLSEVELLDASGNVLTTNDFTLVWDTSDHGLGQTYPPGENPGLAVDGNVNTKWLDYRAGDTRNAEQRAAVYIEFQFANAVQLSGYRWYTANDSDSRDPAAWRLLASDDGVNWKILDKVSGFTATTTRKVLAYERANGYKYYRFKVDETRSATDPMMQLSDVSLYDEGGQLLVSGTDFTLSWDEDMCRTSNNYSDSGTETPRQAVDSANGVGNVGTKWLDRRIGDFSDYVWIQFNMTSPVKLSKYTWSTANDFTGRDPGDWRLLASTDGTNWSAIDTVTGYNATTDRKVLAYTKEFPGSATDSEGMELAVPELSVDSGKTLSVTSGVSITTSLADVKKTGSGTLVLGDAAGSMTIHPFYGLEMSEGTLKAENVAFRLGGTVTSGRDADFVVGTGTAVVNGGSIYSVGPGSGSYSAFQVASGTNGSGSLYATNVDVTARGRIRIGTGGGATAYVEKVGGDWKIQDNAAYGRLLLGEGKNSNSEFYHRGGTLETWSYLCIGVNSESTTGRNYFELDGGTVTQAHNNDIRIGDNGGAGVTNELCVKSGTLNARTDIRVGNKAPAILTIDGGEVNARNGTVYLAHTSEADEPCSAALNGGVLRTQKIAHGGGNSYGFVVFNGGELEAVQDGTLIAANDKLFVTVGANGGTIDNQGHSVSIESDIGGDGTLTLNGSGTMALSSGVTVASSVLVKSGSLLSASEATETAAAVSNLTFEAGAKLGLTSGAKAISVDSLAMPESGTVTLCSHTGAALTMGRYEVLTLADMPEGLKDKFTLSLGDDLYGSFSKEGDTLILTVTGADVAVWTGAVDGDMSNTNNWFLGSLPVGRPAIFNSTSAATLTCTNAFTPTTITFSDGCAAVTINMGEGGSLSSVEEIINDSTSTHVINVPVTFEGDVVLNAKAPIDFAGGVTGKTLDLTDSEEAGRHLKGTYNLETWTLPKGSLSAFIDGGATVNVGAATNLGEVRIEGGGRLTTGSYTLNATSEDYVLFYNMGTFEVTGAMTNTSSVLASMFSSDNTYELKGTNIIEKLVNIPTAEVDFILGKYGDKDAGHDRWDRGTYQFGGIEWGANGRMIGGYRQCAPHIYFSKPCAISAVAAEQFFGFLETYTFHSCDLEGNEVDVVFDCDVGNIPYGSVYYGNLVFEGSGEFAFAAGRKIDMHTKTTTVGSGTTLGVAGSGTLTYAGGTLTLEDGSVLGFNYTRRSVEPVLDVTDRTVNVNGGIKVKITSAPGLHPAGGRHVLTAGGKFAGKTVSLADGSAGWVTAVGVDTDGNIVIDVKPAPFVIKIR